MEQWESPGAAILLTPASVSAVVRESTDISGLIAGLTVSEATPPTFILQSSMPILDAYKVVDVVISDSEYFYYDELALKLCIAYSPSLHISKTSVYYYTLARKSLAESVWEAEAILDLSVLG